MNNFQNCPCVLRTDCHVLIDTVSRSSDCQLCARQCAPKTRSSALCSEGEDATDGYRSPTVLIPALSIPAAVARRSSATCAKTSDALPTASTTTVVRSNSNLESPSPRSLPLLQPLGGAAHRVQKQAMNCPQQEEHTRLRCSHICSLQDAPHCRA